MDVNSLKRFPTWTTVLLLEVVSLLMALMLGSRRLSWPVKRASYGVTPNMDSGAHPIDQVTPLHRRTLLGLQLLSSEP